MRVAFDGGQLYRWKEEDGKLYRAHVSLDELRLMAENRSRGRPRDLDFGRLAARMSEAQYGWLLKQYPGLASGDGKERTKMWQRLSQDPDYRDIFVNRV